jgi:hypothetical protein
MKDIEKHGAVILITCHVARYAENQTLLRLGSSNYIQVTRRVLYCDFGRTRCTPSANCRQTNGYELGKFKEIASHEFPNQEIFDHIRHKIS